MDDDSKKHWNDVLSIVKQANSEGQVELDPVRRARLQATVYEHIDKEFPTDRYSQIKTHDRRNLINVLDWWRNIKIPVPAMALAASLVLVSGILLNSNLTSDTYYDLPESILVANLDAQIESQGGSRGLIGSMTLLRTSFINGALQAHMDLAGSKKETEGNSSDLWFREGFQIEVIHLAAKKAISTRNSEVLKDALRHYGAKNKHNIEVLENVDINTDYLERRHELNDVSDLSSPDSWERIYRLTRALKIHAH